MKKISLLLLASLFVATFCYAADVDTGTVAELYEHPKGRSVIFDGSELVTVWYKGTVQGSIGVSGTVASASLNILFYEDGQEVTAARFNAAADATIALGVSGQTSNTVKKLVGLINSDSSGYFKAAQGRDATPGTTTFHTLPIDIVNLLSTEDDAIDNAQGVLKEDTSSSLQLLAGFKPNTRKTYRLKAIKGSVKGTGNAMIRVWDDDDVILRLGYDLATYNSATPNLQSLTDYNAKGLAGTKGKNLTVVTDWSGTLSTDAEAGVNTSIIVGEWTE